MSELAQSMMLTSAAMQEAYRKAFRELGPRHRNVDRWIQELGWGIERRALEAYLAPESPKPQQDKIT